MQTTKHMDIELLIAHIQDKLQKAHNQIIEQSTNPSRQQLHMLQAISQEWAHRVSCYRKACQAWEQVQQGIHMPMPASYYQRQKDKEERILRRIAQLFNT